MRPYRQQDGLQIGIAGVRIKARGLNNVMYKNGDSAFELTNTIVVNWGLVLPENSLPQTDPKL